MKITWRRKLNIKQLSALLLLSGLLFCTVSAAYCNSPLTVYAKEENKKVNSNLGNEENEQQIEVYNGEISMNIDYGYSQYVKYGRYMSVYATVKNEGEDFNGWIQVIAPQQDGNIVYRKKVNVNAKSKDSFTVTLPLSDDTGLLQIKLVDVEQNTILEVNRKMMIGNYDGQVYIGVLSNDPEKLNYLNTIKSKVFYLKGNNLTTDYRELDLLDVLVINQYDTSQLNAKELEAIQKWVNRGGTLVVGTGEYSDETLSGLKDTFSINSKNIKYTENTLLVNKDLLIDLKQDILNYKVKRNFMLEGIKNRNEVLKANGKEEIKAENIISEKLMNSITEGLKIKSVVKKCGNAILTNGYYELTMDQSRIFQIRSSGSGIVELFSFNLGLEENNQSIGWALLNKMLENMSITKKEQLQEEYYGTYTNYDINQSISYTDAKKVPKVISYLMVLLLYIILIGPLSYFILKKLDKRSFIWIIVPILAVLFTVVVYVIGSGTRIQKPFAGYIEFMSFLPKNKVVNEVYFSLTTPYNHKYSIELEGENNISALTNSEYNYYMENVSSKNEIEYEKYLTSINYNQDKTILEVNNNPAFSPIYYQTESTYEKENKLSSNIHYTGGEIKGTITNNFDFNILNTMLICDGYIVNLGTIEQGKTITLKGKEAFFLSYEDTYFSDDFINRIAGGSAKVEENNADTNRKANILYYLGDKKLLEYQDGYIVGFISTDSTQKSINENSVVYGLSNKIDCYGTKVVTFPVKPNHTEDNEILVPSITSFMEKVGNYFDLYYSYHILDANEQTVEYHLPAIENIVAFEYLKDRNKKFEQDYVKSFSGKIYFLNHDTGKYDEVFQSGLGSKMTELNSYLTKENTITIRYSTDMSMEGYQMLLPEISYWKEANSNAEN